MRKERRENYKKTIGIFSYLYSIIFIFVNFIMCTPQFEGGVYNLLHCMIKPIRVNQRLEYFRRNAVLISWVFQSTPPVLTSFPGSLAKDSGLQAKQPLPICPLTFSQNAPKF